MYLLAIRIYSMYIVSREFYCPLVIKIYATSYVRGVYPNQLNLFEPTKLLFYLDQNNDMIVLSHYNSLNDIAIRIY